MHSIVAKPSDGRCSFSKDKAGQRAEVRTGLDHCLGLLGGPRGDISQSPGGLKLERGARRKGVKG